MKVFFDGTACGKYWQNYISENLKLNYKFYNNTDKTDVGVKQKDAEKEQYEYILYFISPKMEHFDTVFESVDDSNKYPSKTIFCYEGTDEETTFSSHQIKSLVATGKMIQRNGGQWFENLDAAIQFLNGLRER